MFRIFFSLFVLFIVFLFFISKSLISLFLNFPLSSFFLIIENLESNLLFVELFEFLPLKKPEVLFIKVFLLRTALVKRRDYI